MRRGIEAFPVVEQAFDGENPKLREFILVKLRVVAAQGSF